MRPPTASVRAATASAGARSWPTSCARSARASSPRTSGCPTAAAGARPGCAARRSRCWPGSAPPGTRGSSRAATCARRSTCSRPSARALRLTPAERAHLILLGRGEQAPAVQGAGRGGLADAAPPGREHRTRSRVPARPPLGLPGLEHVVRASCSAGSPVPSRCRATTSGCGSWIRRDASCARATGRRAPACSWPSSAPTAPGTSAIRRSRS